VDINELNNRKRPVYIAYYSQHPTFPVISQCVASLLAEDGIKVEFIKYDLQSPKSEEVDIWIQPMGIATRREDAIAGWLLDYSDIEKMASAEDFERWKQRINDWRKEPKKPFPAKDISRDLIEQSQIIPMFHCWMGISHDHCGTLQNAKCNALGWFDFSKVWVKPDAVEEEHG
jgi:SgrR family transcriptional regulator